MGIVQGVTVCDACGASIPKVGSYMKAGDAIFCPSCASLVEDKTALAKQEPRGRRHNGNHERPRNPNAKKQCPKCKEWIDKNATKCPHCRSQQPAPTWATFAAIATLLIVGIWGYHSCSSMFEGGSYESESNGDKIGAWLIAQEFINDRLKSPGTADYGWQVADERVTILGGGKYRVRGWVDAQNAFGAKVRSDFVLTVQYQGNDKWRLVGGPVITQR